MTDYKSELENLSKEQLKDLLNESQTLQNRFFNYEQSVKKILNSIYGAFGNEWFYFFNINIAESITLQGQNAILYTEKLINLYFTDFWHKDKELHEKLGIKVSKPCTKPVVIYIDTDSCYLTFEEALENSNWDKGEKEFIASLYNLRLKDYIEKVLQKYADSYGSENYLSFELESIARNAIFLAKKKYIQNILWTDPDVHYEDLTQIKTKGWDTVQSSTPTASRAILEEALVLFFGRDDLHISDIVKFLKEAKKKFMLADISDVSVNQKMNNYDKYILDDKNEFEIALKCPPTCRSAGYHNFLLNNSPKYKTKYQLIQSGEKIKMYYSLDKTCDMFAYIAGSYPYEFAPKVDYETQFEKTVIDPINKILETMGMNQLNRNLIYAGALF